MKYTLKIWLYTMILSPISLLILLGVVINTSKTNEIINPFEPVIKPYTFNDEVVPLVPTFNVCPFIRVVAVPESVNKLLAFQNPNPRVFVVEFKNQSTQTRTITV
jgi:hypothetical protein